MRAAKPVMDVAATTLAADPAAEGPVAVATGPADPEPRAALVLGRPLSKS